MRFIGVVRSKSVSDISVLTKFAFYEKQLQNISTKRKFKISFLFEYFD